MGLLAVLKVLVRPFRLLLLPEDKCMRHLAEHSLYSYLLQMVHRKLDSFQLGRLRRIHLPELEVLVHLPVLRLLDFDRLDSNLSHLLKV